MIENHPYRPLADFWRKLVRRLARHGSTFSEVGASDKPGAVQLGQLTPKQVEVLELLTEHLTSKVIARRLGIHPNTIDQRIGKVRDLWGTADRGDTVRRYKELQAICGKTTYGSEAVDGTPVDMEQVDDVVLEPEMILAAEPTARMVDRDQDPSSSAERPFGLQGLDVKLGKVGRLGLVLAFAMAVAITFAAMLAISDALGRLL